MERVALFTGNEASLDERGAISGRDEVHVGAGHGGAVAAEVSRHRGRTAGPAAQQEAGADRADVGAVRLGRHLGQFPQGPIAGAHPGGEKKKEIERGARELKRANHLPFSLRLGLHRRHGAFDRYRYHEVAQRCRRRLSVGIELVVEPHVRLARFAFPVRHHVERRTRCSRLRLHLIL